jgi:shikimate dehydrogenase
MEARRLGHKASGGLGMLLYQGALSFEIWTGRKAPVDVMRKAIE